MPLDVESARENWDRYVHLRDGGHLDYLRKRQRCEDFFAGLQWEESIRRRLESQGKPVVTVNEIFASLAALMGEQIRNRAEVSFAPGRNGDEKVAETLNKIWLHTTRVNRYSWLENEVAADGFIGSRGYIDTRISFDDHMQGEVEIRKLNPANVLVDSDAEDYDPDTWSDVIISKWVSPQTIEALYGKADAELLNMRSTATYGFDSLTFDNPKFDVQQEWWRHPPRAEDGDANRRRRRFIRMIERQYKKLMRVDWFVDRLSGDMRRVPPNWDVERAGFFAERFNLAIIKRQTEVIHWKVTADDVVLHDDESPYEWFTVTPYFPYFRYGRTIGLVEHALSPAEMTNKVLSQEFHVVNTTANSGWKVRKGALQNMTVEELEQRGAETGLVVELDSIDNLDKILPNQVPTGLDRLSFKSQEYTKRVLNAPDSLRGFDREDVAARSTDIKRQQAASALAKPFENMNYTRSLVADKAVDLVQAYYTEERQFKILNAGPAREMLPVVINQVQADGSVLNDLTIGEYAAVVTSVPPRDTYEQQQFAEVLQMRQLGVPIPDEFLVEASTLARKAELLEQMRAQSGESAQQQQELQQLATQVQLLEIELKKADIVKKQADARLADARAQVELQSAGEGENGDLEAAKVAAEIVDRREEMAADLEMRQLELTTELEIKRAELAMKQQEMAAEMQMKRVESQANLAMQREKQQQDMTLKTAETEERMKIQRSTAREKAKSKPRAAA